MAERVGETTCRKTGHQVTLWDVNANLPRPPAGATAVYPARPPADDFDAVIDWLRAEYRKIVAAGGIVPDDHPYVRMGRWLVHQKTLAK